MCTCRHSSMKVLSHSRLMRRAKFSPRVIRCIFQLKSSSSSASGSPCSRHRISPHDRVRSPGIFAYLRRWSGSNLWSTPTKPAGHFVAIGVLFCVPVLPICSLALPVSSYLCNVETRGRASAINSQLYPKGIPCSSSQLHRGAQLTSAMSRREEERRRRHEQ